MKNKLNAVSRSLLEMRLSSLLALSIRSYVRGLYGDAYNYREQAYAIFSALESFTTVELRDFNQYWFDALYTVEEEDHRSYGRVLGDYVTQLCDIQEAVRRYNKGGTTL